MCRIFFIGTIFLKTTTYKWLIGITQIKGICDGILPCLSLTTNIFFG